MKDHLARIRGLLFKWRCLLARRSIRIGPGLKIYGKLEIRGPGKVVIGKDCLIENLLGSTSQHVTLYTHDKQAIIKIGDHVRLYAARISSRFAITIGDNVLIEEAGVVDTDFHTIDKGRNLPEAETRAHCEVLIGDRVSIGSRSIVAKSVHIGDDTLVGPGSIVSKSLPAKSFAMGNPARVVTADKRGARGWRQ